MRFSSRFSDLHQEWASAQGDSNLIIPKSYVWRLFVILINAVNQTIVLHFGGEAFELAKKKYTNENLHFGDAVSELIGGMHLPVSDDVGAILRECETMVYTFSSQKGGDAIVFVKLPKTLWNKLLTPYTEVSFEDVNTPRNGVALEVSVQRVLKAFRECGNPTLSDCRSSSLILINDVIGPNVTRALKRDLTKIGGFKHLAVGLDDLFKLMGGVRKVEKPRINCVPLAILSTVVGDDED
jgi:hypothetical protein